MLRFLSEYSDKHTDMNDALIRGIRLNDNVVEKIEEMCREMEKQLADCIKYTGVTFDSDENSKKFAQINTSSKKKNAKTGKFENVMYVNINRTYCRTAIFHFDVNYKDPRTHVVSKVHVNMPIDIPDFIDDYHYYIRGNKYSAPYQLTDAITYLGKDDSIVLKTLTRAIKLSRTPDTITDVHGMQFKSHTFHIHVSNKKIPFLLYYFAWYGFFNTLEFFGVHNTIKVYDVCPAEANENVIFFKFGKLYLGVSRDDFNTCLQVREIVSTILALGKKNICEELIKDTMHWRMCLGAYISQTRTLERGASLLTTFYVCLDARTIRNIKNIVGGAPKDNSFRVLRWMFINYAMLTNKNTSLRNKRLRYAEYLISPLVRDVQMKIYRFLKTRPKMRDVKRLLDIFKPPRAILPNAIIGKVKYKTQMLNITKCSAQVNDLVLLGSALKYSKGGPGTAIERIGKRAGITFRQSDTSYIGQVDLITSSSTNVGISGNLTPFANVDEKTFMFKV